MSDTPREAPRETLASEARSLAAILFSDIKGYSRQMDADEAGALDVQVRLATHNDTVAPEEAIEVRIGVHVGDVLRREDDLFGEAVNLAARLEPLSPVGGLCVSATVFEQVRRKVNARQLWQRQEQLKNISEPRLIFGLAPAEERLTGTVVHAPARKSRSKPRCSRRPSTCPWSPARPRSPSSMPASPCVARASEV